MNLEQPGLDIHASEDRVLSPVFKNDLSGENQNNYLCPQWFSSSEIGFHPGHPKN